MDEREKNSTKPQHQSSDDDLVYMIHENPTWYYAVLLGFQHYITMVGSVVSVPIILSKSLCIANNPLIVGELISTIMFVSGIATMLQSTIGIRLPIIQGSTMSFLVPTLTILNLPEYKCPMATNLTNANATSQHDWTKGMREIQGSIAIASIFQVIIGASGAAGFLLRYIGPLTVAPTICLIGLSLYEVAVNFAEGHWGIAIMTVTLLVIFSQAPLKVRLLKLFPVMLAMSISWIVCMIITFADGFPKDSTARTDNKLHVLKDAKWFRLPYPGQWGTPTIRLASILGMASGVIASILESLGDYIVCARISGAPALPSHAINRGVMVEGLACILAGLIGSGNATTSFSNNIAALKLTKVGSRRVAQWASVIMITLGLFAKFGAVFTLLPHPIVGGVLWVLFGWIAAVGLSNLQFVNMDSARNQFVLSFSIFNGLIVSSWVKTHPGAIDTGSPTFDEILLVLLGTPMAVGGITAAFFDNVLPGTLEDRGLTTWRLENKKNKSKQRTASLKVYDLPFIQGYLNRWKWVQYIPFLPYHNIPLRDQEKDTVQMEIVSSQK